MLDKKEIALRIRKAVVHSLTTAEDNFARAEHQLKNVPTLKTVKTQWGKSGKTFIEIYQEYEKEFENAQQTVEFLEKILTEKGL